MKSILQTNKECWICGSTTVHEHHVFEGSANRKKSEQYGLKIYLCPRHHNLSNDGVHENLVLALSIKKFAQRKFEDKWGHEKFMEVFHKNYL